MKSRLTAIFIILLFILTPLITFIPAIPAWKNGQTDTGTGTEFSASPEYLNYGTHDWIAQHALDWMITDEKEYLLDNLATYLYGTELPDKPIAQGGFEDSYLHHIFYNETGDLKNASAALRAKEEYDLAVDYLENGDIYNGTLHLGAMTHYIADVAVFGNVMNATYWGAPNNYTNYMDFVNSKMASYDSEFNSYLGFISSLGIADPDEAAFVVAYNTTFNPDGYRNCTWMDVNYDWADPEFKDRCGESLNLAVNTIGSVISDMYKNNLTTPAPPRNLQIDSIAGHSINLSWLPNSEKNIRWYSIFVNETDSATQFGTVPIAQVTSKSSKKYHVQNLVNETTYYFKIRAESIVGKDSGDSNIVHATTLDVSPPPIPKLRDLPEFVSEPKLTITGFSYEPGVLIEVFLNNDFSQPAAENYSSTEFNGIFRVEITLENGKNNITARAVDDSDNPSLFAPYQIITLDIAAPAAEAGENIKIELGKEPVTVMFDGSNSNDNIGVIINYTWNFDYFYQVIYLYGVSPKFEFKQPGEFQVRLNVTDQVGNWNIDDMWVNVTQMDIENPYITFKFPEMNAVNQSVNLTLRAKFNEPLNVSSLKVALESNIEGVIQIPGPDYKPGGYLTLTPFINLTYGRTYTVMITGKDLAGNSLLNGSWTFTTVPRPEDFDNDHIPDVWEWKYGLDANSSDSWDDPDGDGLTNLEEYNKGYNSTNPLDPDTDGDGMVDKFERIYSLNPLDPNDRDSDPDTDGKTNYEEYLGLDGLPGNNDWTNPFKTPDSDTPDSDGTKAEDLMTIWIALGLIVTILIVLLLIAWIIRYKDTGADDGAKKSDEYLEVEDADELGVGGTLLFEESKNYKVDKKLTEPETARSLAVGINAAKTALTHPHQTTTSSASTTQTTTSTTGITQKPPSSQNGHGLTPAEILSRAKLQERKCPKCGAGLPSDTSYCFECGTVLDTK